MVCCAKNASSDARSVRSRESSDDEDARRTATTASESDEETRIVDDHVLGWIENVRCRERLAAKLEARARRARRRNSRPQRKVEQRMRHGTTG